MSAGGLAGCSSEDEPEDEDDPGNEEQETNPARDKFVIHTNPAKQLERVGYNPWNPTTDGLSWVPWVSADPAITYNIEEAEFKPFVIGDWEITDETVTWTLNDEYEWNWDNGEPVTAQDFVANMEINIGIYGGKTEFVSNVEVLDDDTFEYTLSEPANRDILLSAVGVGAVYSSGPLGDFADQMAEATTEGEVESIVEELQEFTIDPSEGDSVRSYGPFVLDEVQEGYYIGKANEHHPQYENLNYDTIESIETAETSAVQGMLQAGNLDHAWGRFSTTFLDQLPDKYEVWEKSMFGGNSIDFQLSDDIYGIREVRQAFNHILNKEGMAEAVDYNKVPDRYTSGMPDQIAESWIGEDTLANFTDYTGSNAERARELLREAGFEEGDDTWYKPDGEEWTVQLTAPAGDTDRVNMMDVARSFLNDFGLNAEMNTVEIATYWQRYRERDWKIATWAYGARGSPHPYFDFLHQFRGADPNEARPSPEQKPWAGTPYELEVPGEVGDPDSSMETFEFRQLIAELGETQDRDRARELITQLGWIYNQFVFKVPISLETQPNVLNQQDWDYPSEEEFFHRFLSSVPWPQMMSEGVLQAREE